MSNFNRSQLNFKLILAKSSLRDTFGQALKSMGTEFPNMIVLDADLSSSTKTDQFAKAFPGRFINVGIAEQNMVGIAMGLAVTGKIPVVSGFTCFTLTRAWEFIRNAAYDHLPLKICTTHAGLSPDLDGGSHQALEDLAIMGTIPGIHIFCPADPQEIPIMLHTMMAISGICYMRLMRNALPWVWDSPKKWTPGEILRPQCIYESQPKPVDITLCSTGSMTAYLPPILQALEEHHVSARAFHFGCIKPLDVDSLQEIIISGKRIVTLEEHNVTAGFGAQLSRVLGLIAPKLILSLGIRDEFGQTGPVEELFKFYRLDPDSIIQQVLNWLKTTQKD